MTFYADSTASGRAADKPTLDMDGSVDAAPPTDSGSDVNQAAEASGADAQRTDAQRTDAGLSDADPVDGHAADAGRVDGSAADVDLLDAEPMDAIADTGKSPCGNTCAPGEVCQTDWFSSARVYPAPSPFHVTMADVDADGLLDLVTANRASASVSVLLANQSGTFQPAFSAGVGAYPIKVVPGDFEHDGGLDLLVAHHIESDAGGLGLLHGHGDATFESVQSLQVLLGNGDGWFTLGETFETGAFPASLALADVDQDGELDLLAGISPFPGGIVALLLDNGDGTLRRHQAYIAGSQGHLGGGSRIGIADVNGDGLVDSAATNCCYIVVLLESGFRADASGW